MRKRLLPVVLSCLGLAAVACGHGAISYQSPDPQTPGLAHITALYSDPPSSGGTVPPTVTLHVYELADACVDDEALDAGYRGSLDLDRFERQIAVPSERFLLFRVTLNAWEGAATVSCRTAAGFTPEREGVYRLDFSAYATRSCRLHLRDAEGRDVQLFAPVRC